MDFEAIAEGFHIEGLCPDGEDVWFTDAFASGIHRLSPDGTVDDWLPGKPMVPALLLNDDGKLLHSGQKGIEWLDPSNGETGTLIDAFDGEAVTGVNEMIPDGQGGLYFGSLDHRAIQDHRAPAPGGLYHLSVSRELSLVHRPVAFPNGIGINSDGTQLFCNESFTGGITAYDINGDGTFGTPRRLLEMEDCDGMALDVNGDLWVTGFSTSDLLRVSPKGDVIERISTPAPGISNVRFGGRDCRDLFITATSPVTISEFASGGPVETRGSRLYRGRSDVAGMPIPPTRFELS